MPGGTWWDPVGPWGCLVGPRGTLGMPGGTLVVPFRTLFRLVMLVMPGQARWNLVGPSQTLGMPGGTWWDLVGPRGCLVGHLWYLLGHISGW